MAFVPSLFLFLSFSLPAAISPWAEGTGPQAPRVMKSRVAPLLPPGTVLFDRVVPPEVRLPRVAARPPFLVQVRYVRVEIPIWGYKVAALFDDGPWCRGEWQKGIGATGLSVVNVQRDPAGTKT